MSKTAENQKDHSAEQLVTAWSEALVAGARQSSLRVAVLGMGYVGLPLSEALSQAGFAVRGYDLDQDRIRKLSAGESYLSHVSDARVRDMIDRGNFEVSDDESVLAGADVFVICVPTPVTASLEPDLSHVRGAGNAVARHLRHGNLVVLESTTFPGTTDDMLKPLCEKSGLRAGVDFALGYSPEREDPGNDSFSTIAIPRIIAANTPHELACVDALYSRVTRTVPVSNVRTAEATKLTENIFRFVNIALANELNQAFSAMDIDAWEVMDAAASKPFGFMPFYPGPGVGGHCIPVDPFYMTWKARSLGVNLKLVDAAGEIIHARPVEVVDAVSRALDDAHARSINGAHVLVVGVAYKRDIDDVRDSPALEILELLKARGAVVGFVDSYVPHVRLSDGVLHAQPVDGDLSAWDCAVIVTDHRNFDYEALLRSVPLVVDTRNAVAGRGRGNVRRA